MYSTLTVMRKHPKSSPSLPTLIKADTFTYMAMMLILERVSFFDDHFLTGLALGTFSTKDDFQKSSLQRLNRGGRSSSTYILYFSCHGAPFCGISASLTNLIFYVIFAVGTTLQYEESFSNSFC
jgi:hypothetical protein